MTDPRLDPTALEAAVSAFYGFENDPNWQGNRLSIEAAIHAYLSALPAGDDADLVE